MITYIYVYSDLCYTKEGSEAWSTHGSYAYFSDHDSHQHIQHVSGYKYLWLSDITLSNWLYRFFMMYKTEDRAEDSCYNGQTHSIIFYTNAMVMCVH